MDTFLKNKVVVVTGGAGLLGIEFCIAVIMAGGIPVIADIDKKRLNSAKKKYLL